MNALRSTLKGHATSGESAYVELTAVRWPEGDAWVSQCVELDIASFGPTPDEAEAELMDALGAYLNTLEVCRPPRTRYPAVKKTGPRV